MPFDWLESVNKYGQVLVNCGMELQAVKLYLANDAIKYCELLLTGVKLPQGKSESKEHEVVARTLNLVGKLCKSPEGKAQVAASSAVQKRLLEYFCSEVADI